MIVSFKHGFIFIKGIKVASTSVEAFLSGAVEEDAIVTRGSTFEGHRPRNFLAGDGRGEFSNHMGARDVRDLLGAERFFALRRLAVLRDPYEKVRSFYYMKRGRGLDYDADRAIADCSSEADRLLDRDGLLLATDLVCFERIDEGLARFFAEVGLPFPGRLTHREKSWHRAQYGHERIDFDPAQDALIRRKFAFDFAIYERMEWPLVGAAR